MKKKFVLFTGLILFLLFSATAFAMPASTDVPEKKVVVTPNDLDIEPGLSWDYNGAKPDGVDVPDAPLGSGSFYANIPGSGSDHSTFRIYPDFFEYSPQGLTLSDISNLSYWTKNTDANLADWQVVFYTVPENSSDEYGFRIDFNLPSGNADTWTQSGIFSTLGILSIDDNGTGSSLTGNELILYIDFVAGPATNSYLDGITINTGAGDYIIDLEPAAVPVPTTILLFGFGLIGLVGTARKSA